MPVRLVGEIFAFGSHVEKIHRCNCGRAFQLKQSLVLNGAATKIMRKEAPQKSIGWVGDEAVKDCWSGRHDSARSRAYDSGDPAAISLFGEPRR